MWLAGRACLACSCLQTVYSCAITRMRTARAPFLADAASPTQACTPCGSTNAPPHACLPVQRTPFYYILAADSRFKPTGRHLEAIGTFDPVPGAPRSAQLQCTCHQRMRRGTACACQRAHRATSHLSAILVRSKQRSRQSCAPSSRVLARAELPWRQACRSTMPMPALVAVRVLITCRE